VSAGNLGDGFETGVGRRKNAFLLPWRAQVLRDKLCSAPGIEVRARQRWRKLAPNAVGELKRTAVDSFLPNPVIIYDDMAVFRDHPSEALDRWNKHAESLPP